MDEEDGRLGPQAPQSGHHDVLSGAFAMSLCQPPRFSFRIDSRTFPTDIGARRQSAAVRPKNASRPHTEGEAR